MAYGDVKSDNGVCGMHSFPMPANTQARNMSPKQVHRRIWWGGLGARAPPGISKWIHPGQVLRSLVVMIP